MKNCLLCLCIMFFCLSISIPYFLADCGNPLQDTCPTLPAGQQTIFINGYPCKNPAAISASDFKTSKLNHGGDTDNFERSSVSIITAADFPGLNTLGLSIGRTDLGVDGMVPLHSHPRASEMLYVSTGVVVAGFIDTGNKVFLKSLGDGDVFVIPRGLLHFSLNGGFEPAIVFSVFNSQNPGVASITGAMFEHYDTYVLKQLMTRFFNISEMEADGIRNASVGLKFDNEGGGVCMSTVEE